jgi:hypothetical protein
MLFLIFPKREPSYWEVSLTGFAKKLGIELNQYKPQVVTNGQWVQ